MMTTLVISAAIQVDIELEFSAEPYTIDGPVACFKVGREIF